MNRPQAGAPAPNFQAIDDEGRSVRLEDFRGKWIALYVYRLNLTPECYLEACSFRDNHHRFVAEGVEVVGVSRDSPESHRKFKERRQLPFKLLADPDGRVVEAFGCRGFLGVPQRTTFLIAPDGVVAHVFDHVRVRRHGDEVLEVIRRVRADWEAASRLPPSEQAAAQAS